MRTGLEVMRVRGYQVVPLCPTVRAYLEEHPEDLAGVDARFLDRRVVADVTSH